MASRRKINKSILIIAICAGVTAPMLSLPIGVREGKSAHLLVRNAYASTFKTEEIEEPTLDMLNTVPVLEGDGLVASEGQLITSTYFEGYGPEDVAKTTYDDVNTVMVYQSYDSADLPVELLDPMYFTSDETQYYIEAANSILKEKPDMDSITLQTLYQGQGVIRTGIGDTWSRVMTEDGVEGYVLTSSISYEMVWIAIDRTIWVDTGSLSLRAEPSTSSEILATLPDETRLRATLISDKWYFVTTDSGLEGYVYISYTTQIAPPTPTPKPTPKPATGNNGGGNGGGSSSGGGSGVSSGSSYVPPVISGVNGSSVIAVAESLLGVTYVYGGESTSGVDCSGLVVYCYRYVGVNGLPHLADSLKNYGVAVDRSDLRAGDIICYDYGNGYCGHVALYVGGGQVIHASSSKGKVVYGNLDMLSIITIRRVIG